MGSPPQEVYGFHLVRVEFFKAKTGKDLANILMKAEPGAVRGLSRGQMSMIYKGLSEFRMGFKMLDKLRKIHRIRVKGVKPADLTPSPPQFSLQDVTIAQTVWPKHINGVVRLLDNNGIVMRNVKSHLAVKSQEDLRVSLIQLDPDTH